MEWSGVKSGELSNYYSPGWHANDKLTIQVERHFVEIICRIRPKFLRRLTTSSAAVEWLADWSSAKKKKTGGRYLQSAPSSWQPTRLLCRSITGARAARSVGLRSGAADAGSSRQRILLFQLQWAWHSLPRHWLLDGRLLNFKSAT